MKKEDYFILAVILGFLTIPVFIAVAFGDNVPQSITIAFYIGIFLISCLVTIGGFTTKDKPVKSEPNKAENDHIYWSEYDTNKYNEEEYR